MIKNQIRLILLCVTLVTISIITSVSLYKRRIWHPLKFSGITWPIFNSVFCSIIISYYSNIYFFSQNKSTCIIYEFTNKLIPIVFLHFYEIRWIIFYKSLEYISFGLNTNPLKKNRIIWRIKIWKFGTWNIKDIFRINMFSL